MASHLRVKLSRLAERESLRPDLGRGLRCMLGTMVPISLSLAGNLPVEVVFAALAAQSIALVDVRGAYSLRFTLLLAMAGILAAVSALGALAAEPAAAALGATVLIALATGLWRHLSSDYGPSLAVSSSLLFFIALALPGGTAAASHHLLGALAGGLWGVLLQVALWPIRPQHPLRVAVSDSWLASADLFAAMIPAASSAGLANAGEIAKHEAALRTAVDKAYAALSAAKAARPNPLISRLEQLNFTAVRLATRVVSFHSAQEALALEPGFNGLAPSFLPVLTALTNTARTVALAVVSRQPGHLATAEVRLRRLNHLLQALRDRLSAQTGDSTGWAQLVEIIRHIEEHLPEVGGALRATIGRADERAAFSLELLDLQTLTLRPLAAALNLNRHVDPALIRYTLRIAVLTLAGVALFKHFHLPHGYWLPFTMVLVLQPDYGATRQRAAERLGGTLAGSILASLLLWLQLPFGVLIAAAAATNFLFGYHIKRSYAVAVIFVTLFVVLLLEARGPVSITVTLERIGSTTAGGALALLAALVFWPVWEKNRFQPILTRALRANAAYLKLIAGRLASGGAYDAEVMQAKRRAEGANSAVFSSLQRMFGDPKNRQDRIEQIAALANGNQRLTRALNLLGLHLRPGAALPQPEISRFAECAAEALESIAAESSPNLQRVRDARLALDALRLPSHLALVAEDAPGPPHQNWVFTQLARATTELGAMLLALEAYRSDGTP